MFNTELFEAKQKVIDDIMVFVKQDTKHNASEWYDKFFHSAGFGLHTNEITGIDTDYEYYWERCKDSFFTKTIRIFNNHTYSVEDMNHSERIGKEFQDTLVKDMLIHCFTFESMCHILDTFRDSIWN